MSKFIFGILFLLYFLLNADPVSAVIIRKDETRDIVGNYGAINPHSPYFPHETIPHQRSGTAQTTNVDAYPGNGMGDYQLVRSFTISAHDHDDTMGANIYIHEENGSWTELDYDRDVNTPGGDNLCGETSSI